MTHKEFKETFSNVAQSVIRICAEELGLSPEQIKSKARNGHITDSRKIVSLLLNHHSEAMEGRPNWTRIAYEIRPGLQHCSVYYLSNQAQNLCVTDSSFSIKYNKIKERCEKELGLCSKEIPKYPILVIDRNLLIELGISEQSINETNIKALANRVAEKSIEQIKKLVAREATKLGFEKKIVNNFSK